jgi:hypothetical protein
VFEAKNIVHHFHVVLGPTRLTDQRVVALKYSNITQPWLCTQLTKSRELQRVFEYLSLNQCFCLGFWSFS